MNGKEQIEIVEIKKDVGYLTEKTDKIEQKVDKISGNDLPHIWKKVDYLDKKIAVLTTKVVVYVSIAVFIITMLTSILMKYLIK